METTIKAQTSYPTLNKLSHNKFSDNGHVNEFVVVNNNVSDKVDISNKYDDSVTLDAKFLPEDFDSNVVDTVTKPNKTRRQRLFAYGTIGVSAAALGGLTLLFTKGKLSTGFANFMGSVIERVTKTTDKMKSRANLSKIEELHLFHLQKLRRFAYMARGAVFNFAPFKDVWFQKLLTEKLKLKKTCEAVTKTFKEFSLGTVKKSYKGADKNIEKMATVFEKVNKRILAGEFMPFVEPKESKATIAEIEKRMDVIKSTFAENFGESKIISRSDNMTSKFSKLGPKVYDRIYGNLKGFISDVSSWATFVPETIIAKDKNLFMNHLADKRRVITNSPIDNYHELIDTVKDLEMIINPLHEPSRKALKTLKGLAKDYISVSGPNSSTARKDLGLEINKYLKQIKLAQEKGVYNKTDSRRISALLRRYGKVINTDKKGEIEEILTLYKNLLPTEDYQKVHKAARKASGSLNKAVYNEGFEYTDKLRDFATGSALTDVAFGVAVPTVSTAVAMGVADTKEKKNSVLVKFALPLFVGIGTTTLCTVKLINAGKSLLMGAGTSILTSGISEFLTGIKR